MEQTWMSSFQRQHLLPGHLPPVSTAIRSDSRNDGSLVAKEVAPATNRLLVEDMLEDKGTIAGQFVSSQVDLYGDYPEPRPLDVSLRADSMSYSFSTNLVTESTRRRNRRICTSFTPAFLGMTVTESGNLIFMCLPRHSASRVTTWARTNAIKIRWASVVVAILCAILHCLLVSFRRTPEWIALGNSATPPWSLFLANFTASVLIALRALIFFGVIFVGGNQPILRRVIMGFRPWLLIWQALVLTASMILLLCGKPEEAGGASQNDFGGRGLPVDVYIVALPLFCTSEFIFSDGVVPPHHKAFVYNAISSMLPFIVVFISAIFRWEASVFGAGEYQIEIFLLGDKFSPIIISPRSMAIASIFTVCIQCIRTIWLLFKRDEDWGIMTMLEIPYEIKKFDASRMNMPARTAKRRHDKAATGLGSWLQPFRPRKAGKQIHPQPESSESTVTRQSPPEAASLMTLSIPADRIDYAESQKAPARGLSYRVALLPHDIGFSLNTSTNDYLLHFVTTKKVAAAYLRFTKKNKQAFFFVPAVLNIIVAIYFVVLLSTTEFPGKTHLTAIMIAVLLINTVYTLVTAVRILVCRKLIANFSFWFFLFITFIEGISIAWSFGPRYVSSLSAILVGVANMLCALNIASYDAFATPVSSKPVMVTAFLTTGVCQILVIVFMLFRIGLWSDTDSNLVQQELGWLGQYWNPIATTVSTALTCSQVCFHLSISHAFSDRPHSVILECIFSRVAINPTEDPQDEKSPLRMPSADG